MRQFIEDLNVTKAKFTQLLDVGVREFGILADDAAFSLMVVMKVTNCLMKDMTDWLTENKTSG